MMHEHTLYVLPPVADRGAVAWWVYVDEPDRWRMSNLALVNALHDAAAHLQKMVAYDRGGRRGAPPRIRIDYPGVPNLTPRWTVRITADVREEQPEWTVEILDESAWATTDYDLAAAMVKLAKRIEQAGEKPQPLLVVAPVITSDKRTTFTDAVQAEIARVQQELAKRERALRDEKLQVLDLQQELKALKLGLAAYQRHAGRQRKPRQQLEAV